MREKIREYLLEYMSRNSAEDIMFDIDELLKEEREKTIEEYRRLVTEGIDVGIRCAMCTNHFANEHGCDGGCVVDEYMYKKVMKVIDNHINIDMSIVEQLKGENK